MPRSILKSKSCPLCSKEAISIKRKLTNNEYLEKLSSIKGDEYS